MQTIKPIKILNCNKEDRKIWKSKKIIWKWTNNLKEFRVFDKKTSIRNNDQIKITNNFIDKIKTVKKQSKWIIKIKAKLLEKYLELEKSAEVIAIKKLKCNLFLKYRWELKWIKCLLMIARLLKIWIVKKYFTIKIAIILNKKLKAIKSNSKVKRTRYKITCRKIN